MTVYTGIATRKAPGPFQLVIVGYSPDGGLHYSVDRFVVGMN
jgi:hypothetical protein